MVAQRGVAHFAQRSYANTKVTRPAGARPGAVEQVRQNSPREAETPDHIFAGTTGNELDNPPSTANACPFTYDASSDAREENTRKRPACLWRVVDRTCIDLAVIAVTGGRLVVRSRAELQASTGASLSEESA